MVGGRSAIGEKADPLNLPQPGEPVGRLRACSRVLAAMERWVNVMMKVFLLIYVTLNPDAAAASQAFGLFPEPDITIKFDSVTACQIAADGINALGSGKSDATGVYIDATNEMIAECDTETKSNLRQDSEAE